MNTFSELCSQICHILGENKKNRYDTIGFTKTRKSVLKNSKKHIKTVYPVSNWTLDRRKNVHNESEMLE